MEEEIFNKCLFDKKKLVKYGFKSSKDIYTYDCNILNNKFKVYLKIDGNKITGKVIDEDFQEEYNNFRIKDISGDFVGQVRDEYERLLVDIRDKCAIKQFFKYEQSNRVVKLIKDIYDVLPEFLWEDDSSGALRHNDTKKWFGIIMIVSKDKITKEEKDKELVEVLNIKLAENKIEELLKEKGFYPAYHMNKKSWISIILDDTLDDNYIMEFINESFNLTSDTNTWVIPANPKYYDVISYIKNKIITWHSSKSINNGDVVYIYYGKPYGALLCRGIVLNNNGVDMEIEIDTIFKKEDYPIEILNKWGLTNIRSIRRMPKSVIEKIDNSLT